LKNILSVCAIEHAPFEGVGCIGDWARERGHRLNSVLVYNNEPLPKLDNLDWLVVMGGPMSIYDEQQFPWLKKEKTFIKNAIEARKTIIGICLGSQLVADVLGAKVYKNPHPEIGWFDVIRTKESYHTNLLAGFDERIKVFHWHGDTFELPDGAIPLFQSEACKNQGILFSHNVLGLQFHFEMTEQGIEKMFTDENEHLPDGLFVQSKTEILSRKEYCTENNRKMFIILDKMASF
jgi:GMP synthase-like glutamine amidotransferase